MRPILFLLLLAAVLAGQQAGRPTPAAAFAIVAEEEIHALAGPALRAWAEAIEADGLAVRLVHAAFEAPEEVRVLLQALFLADPPLEGAVLVGRIPVPMLRDAQHLTSAFKMDQERYPMRRSSVPSDRFFEDFDLEFVPLGREQAEPWLHYYALAPDSPQRIEKEIYTARLFPPAPGPEGLARLAATIARLAAARREPPAPLRRALAVGGHGYHSECPEAWTALQVELREALPLLALPGGRLAAYYHSRGPDLKEWLARELQLPGLQLALFHAHGAPDTQYLLGAPALTTVASQIEAVRLFLRQRLRQAKQRGENPAEAQLDLMGRLGVPLAWFEGAFDPAVSAADEAAAGRKDLTAPEIARLAPTARLLVLDQCFNGRFIEAPSVAQAYLHAPGSVQAVVANTVNVLQNQWSDRFLGLLPHGVRVGQYHRLCPYLESHLIGDPTLRFAPDGVDLAAQLRRVPEERIWGPWLEHADAALRGFAVACLAGAPGQEPALLERLGSDPSPIVRMEALRGLVAARGPALEHGLLLGLSDPFEALRRQSAALMGDFGLDAFALPLLAAAVGDPGRRVAFNAAGALQKLDPKALEAARAAFLERDPLAAADPALLERLDRALRPGAVRRGDMEVLENRNEPLQKRIQAARSFRNLRAHDLAGRLLALALVPEEEPALRAAVLEALGWFTLSHRRPELLEGLARLAGDAAAPAPVQAEARRSRARLLAGPNEPWTP